MAPENYQCYYEKNCSGEFLLSDAEIKKHRYDEGGDSAFPPLTAPVFLGMMTYYLFRSYRFFGEQKAAEVIPLLWVQVFLTVSNENGHNSPWETIIQDEKVIAFS
jgi:hypothetical protein